MKIGSYYSTTDSSTIQDYGYSPSYVVQLDAFVDEINGVKLILIYPMSKDGLELDMVEYETNELCGNWYIDN